VGTCPTGLQGMSYRMEERSKTSRRAMNNDRPRATYMDAEAPHSS